MPAVPALVVLMLAGGVLRVLSAREAIFADELSSYWIVTTHGLPDVISIVHTNAEITPPLFFVLSWLTTLLGDSALLVRLPSVVAGIALIPLVWALGRRTVGQAPAMLAAAVTALAPFAVYYSAEARSYSVMLALVVASTWALLAAADTGRRRWWVLYAVAICGAVYSHYTCVFVLLVQFAWVFALHREARKPLVISTAAAVVGFLPWLSGLHNDLTSPTSAILSALSPFTPDDVRIALEHWSVGYPYSSVPLRDLPGVIGTVAFALALLVALVGLLRSLRGRDAPARLWLVVALAAATPAGEALVTIVGTNLFGTRNLAASWPALALALAALVWHAGPRLRVAGAAALVAAFAFGAVLGLDADNRRPDYIAAARIADREAGPQDVVIDTTGVLSPGPLTGLDAALRKPHTILRAGAPQQRTAPFSFVDPVVDLATAVQEAQERRPRRIVLVRTRVASGQTVQTQALVSDAAPAAPYRLVSSTQTTGFAGPPVVEVYER